MRGILIAACLLGACAVLAAGCDDEYNPMDKECGYAENGCWGTDVEPPSCNTGYLCNTSRKGEALAEGKCPSTYGVCEPAPEAGGPDTGPTPGEPTLDGPAPGEPAPDGPAPGEPAPDGPTPGEPTTDGPVPDAAPSVG